MPNEIAIVGAHREVLDRLTSTAEGLSDIVDVIPLNSRDLEEQAADLAREIARLINEGEIARKDLVSPIKKQIAKVDAAFRFPRKRLESIKNRIRQRLAEQAELRARAIAEAVREAEDAAQSRDYERANNALVRASAVPDRTPEGTSVRWTWEPAEVDLSAVPVDFLALDLAKVQAEVKRQISAGTEMPDIPGIRFEKRAVISVRKAK